MVVKFLILIICLIVFIFILKNTETFPGQSTGTCSGESSCSQHTTALGCVYPCSWTPDELSGSKEVKVDTCYQNSTKETCETAGCEFKIAGGIGTCVAKSLGNSSIVESDTCNTNSDRSSCESLSNCEFKDGTCVAKGTSPQQPVRTQQPQPVRTQPEEIVNSVTVSSNSSVRDFTDSPNKKSQSYSDDDCKTLRKRGFGVECTYEPNPDNSSVFNLDRALNTQKKRFKSILD